MPENEEAGEILRLMNIFFAESYRGRTEVPLSELVRDLKQFLPDKVKSKVEEKTVEKILIRGKNLGGSKFVNMVAKKTMGESVCKIPGNYDKKSKMYYPDVSRILTEFQSNAIIGMIKNNNELKIDETADILNISKNEVETLLNALLGQKKIGGQIEGNLFKITSDENDFINALKLSFEEWQQSQRQ